MYKRQATGSAILQKNENGILIKLSYYFSSDTFLPYTAETVDFVCLNFCVVNLKVRKRFKTRPISIGFEIDVLITLNDITAQNIKQKRLSTMLFRHC